MIDDGLSARETLARHRQRLAELATERERVLSLFLALADWLDNDDASELIVDPDFYYGRSDAADRIRRTVEEAR